MFFRNLAISGLIILSLSECSQYEKILKSTDVELKYKKALEYYNDENYGRALAIFEQLTAATRATKRSDTVLFFLANCYYYQSDFILAGEHYKNFSKIYANSPFAEQAEFLAGDCHYQMSPRPELDQTETMAAIDAFKLFKSKYPNSSKVKECNNLINKLNDKLVNKSYINAKLYYNLGEYKASIVALNNALNKFPDTKYREELMYMILESNYLLADKSVESKKTERFQSTLDEYYSFISEFPQSRYKKDAEKIYQASVKVLKVENTNN